ncbi:Tetratricopeptide repeat (TPR) superfamily protein [Trifolium repens]|nr:Tetratricopeptide repeat (TPR) superfamily protein [Trifolium repens]
MENENQSTLRSSPSFEIYNKSHHGDDDYNDPEQVLKRASLSLESIASSDFTFERSKMDLIQEDENEIENDWSTGIQNLSLDDDDDDDAQQPSTPPMYLATGLGVDSGEIVSSDNSDDIDMFVPSLQESEDLDEYYKRKIHEFPSHPSILKKYANFLQGKGELQDAEEYFHRATQADPNDGEILMQYAKLLWENHHDRDRASVYFERAAQSAPQDCDVLAAYASFLWETEDDENEDGNRQTQNDMEKQETEPVKTSKEENVATTNYNEDSNDPDYLKKMIDENPNNPLFLKKYAQFLFQSKRDLEAAENYYSRAVSADPSDGEMISEYATLLWELHHDQEKALSLYEQAVQATPGDSNVLAAYTCFLWETADSES